VTLLAASLGSEGKPNDDAVRAAVIVELLHEATLVHDDVVDEAEMRRGWPSLPAKFKNKVSVLFGDYMLATVLSLTLEARDLDWLDILSTAARRMSRGELLQAARSRTLNMTEGDYIQMISDKTAALFSAACRIGGLCSGLGREQVDILGAYGENLGNAFQIKDDLLDLFGDQGLGKPLGGDLKQRKLTLPLITALANAPPRDGRRVRARIRRGVRRSEIRDVTDFIRTNKGDLCAMDYLDRFHRSAQDALTSLPDLPARQALWEITDFAVERDK